MRRTCGPQDLSDVITITCRLAGKLPNLRDSDNSPTRIATLFCLRFLSHSPDIELQCRANATRPDKISSLMHGFGVTRIQRKGHDGHGRHAEPGASVNTSHVIDASRISPVNFLISIIGITISSTVFFINAHVDKRSHHHLEFYDVEALDRR